jgi:hypothetical protein
MPALSACDMETGLQFSQLLAANREDEAREQIRPQEWHGACSTGRVSVPVRKAMVACGKEDRESVAKGARAFVARA